jgi:hypothetical protein
MRFVVVAGRGLSLAAIGAALVAVIITGVSALSYGQNDGALVAAFFGALVALVSSVWIGVRIFSSNDRESAPRRQAWYAGPSSAVAISSVVLPPLAPREPAWGPYRAMGAAGDRVPASPADAAEAASAPEPLDSGDTRKIFVASPKEAGDTRPMRAVSSDVSTRQIQPAPRPVTPPQDTPRPAAPPSSLPESTGPLDTDPPVRPTHLAL